MKRLVSILLVLSVSAAMAFSQEVKTPAHAESGAAQMDALRRDGFEALFNLDYERARKDFREIARLFPDHPAGPQFLATSLWIETLYETRRLQASLYSSDSFYSPSEDQTDPKVVAQFRAWTREAKRLAEARLKLNPKDADARYFLGAIAGLKASFEEAVERRHFAAMRDGSEAVDQHRDLIKQDPSFHDAEVTIGLYDYVVEPYPGAKILVASPGRGVRASAVWLLWSASPGRQVGRDDARTLLIVLYTRERRFAEAGASPRS